MTSKKQMKSASRLYAVQALFQMEASEQGMNEVRDQFVNHRFGATLEGEEYVEGNVELFEQLLFTAVNQQAAIDQMTDRALVAPHCNSRHPRLISVQVFDTIRVGTVAQHDGCFSSTKLTEAPRRRPGHSPQVFSQVAPQRRDVMQV